MIAPVPVPISTKFRHPHWNAFAAEQIDGVFTGEEAFL